MYEELENNVGTVLPAGFRIISHPYFLERLKILTSHNVLLLQTCLPTLKIDLGPRFRYMSGDAGIPVLRRFVTHNFSTNTI